MVLYIRILKFQGVEMCTVSLAKSVLGKTMSVYLCHETL